jgi:signal peptidase II
MKLKGVYRAFFILFILALNVGCDQVSKSIVRQKLNYERPVSVIKNHFILLKTENTGAFLSLGDSLSKPYRFILLHFIPVIALLFALWLIIVKTNITNTRLVGIIFIIGGGIGNIYDRIAYGSVTDFMHLSIGPLQTGIFNVADVSIMTGMGLILLDTLLRSGQSHGQDAEPEVQ